MALVRLAYHFASGNQSLPQARRSSRRSGASPAATPGVVSASRAVWSRRELGAPRVKGGENRKTNCPHFNEFTFDVQHTNRSALKRKSSDVSLAPPPLISSSPHFLLGVSNGHGLPPPPRSWKLGLAWYLGTAPGKPGAKDKASSTCHPREVVRVQVGEHWERCLCMYAAAFLPEELQISTAFG